MVSLKWDQQDIENFLKRNWINLLLSFLLEYRGMALKSSQLSNSCMSSSIFLKKPNNSPPYPFPVHYSTKKCQNIILYSVSISSRCYEGKMLYEKWRYFTVCSCCDRGPLEMMWTEHTYTIDKHYRCKKLPNTKAYVVQVENGPGSKGKTL